MMPEEASKVAFEDMEEAQAKIHWHLSRAASACLQGLMLGHFYEKEMASVNEWKSRYDAANRARMAI